MNPQVPLLEIRAFKPGDLCRVVAWAADRNDRVPFPVSDDDPVVAARIFLAHAQAEGYMAVCYRGDENCKRAKRFYEGPAACLKISSAMTKLAFIDPQLRGEDRFNADVNDLYASGEVWQHVPRLKAA